MPAKVQASGDQDSGRKIITTIYTILSLLYGSHTFSTYSRIKIKKREVLAYKIGCTQSGYRVLLQNYLLHFPDSFA